ncbi:MAG: c-type cytochrome domain-containing protein [Pirellulaceae bacterium]|nr:c-type cytochrome domain-containing protein [Pirellulaceae bacterium]
MKFNLANAHRPVSIVLTLALSAWSLVGHSIVRGDDLPEKVTFDEHIKPIFREHCSSCHNASDKKSGLSLDNYASTMEGGSGGELLVAGDLESSRLWSLSSHSEQPKMPPNQDKISDAKLGLLKRWIMQGMPENNGSEIMAPKVDLSAMGTVSQSRPDGPPPMPESILKQTPLYTPRAAAISALAASPWSPLIAVGGQEQVVLYHSDTGDLLGILPFPEGEPQSIVFSRDGKLILVGGGRHSHSGYAVLYELKTGTRITRVGDELDIVMAADLSEDNSKIALGGPQKLVRIYDTATGSLLHELKKHTDWIYAVRFSPDGLLVASADRSNGLFVWESESGRFYLDLLGHKNEIRSIAWRPDSLALVSASLDGTLKLWDMNEGKLIKSWDAHAGGALAVAICNAGTMATTGQDKKVRLWDPAGNAAGELPNLPEPGMEIAISVDAKSVAAGDRQGNVWLWEKASPKNVKSLRANPETIEQVLALAEKSTARLAADQTNQQKAWTEFEPKITVAQKLVSESEQAVAQVQSKLSSVQNELQQSSKEIESSGAALMGALANIEKIRQKLQEKLNRLAISKSKDEDTAAVEKEIESFKKSIQDQDASISKLRLDAMEKTSVVAVVQSRIDEFTTQKTKLDSGVIAAKASMQEIEKEADVAKAKLTAANTQVTNQHAIVANLRQELERFNLSMNEWTARSEEVRQQTAQLEKQRLVAQRNIESEQSNEKAASEKISSLREQIEQLQQSIAQLENQQVQAEKLMAEKQAVIDVANSQLGILKAEQQTLNDQIQAYSR